MWIGAGVLVVNSPAVATLLGTAAGERPDAKMEIGGYGV